MLRSLIHRLPLGWALRLTLLRLLAQWQSLLTIVIGVLLAAVIGANGPLYTTAVAQVGMVQRLDQQPDADANIFSRISLTALDVDNLDQTWQTSEAVVKDQVARVFELTLPGWAVQTVVWGESAPLLVVRDGEDIEATRMRVAYYDGWQDATRLVEGEWPTASTDPEIDMQVALGLAASIDLNLEVGDVIVLDQRGWDTSRPIRALITAVVREEDDTSPYWMAPSPLRLEASSQWQAETNVLVSREDFLRAAVDFIPQTRSLIGWRVLFDHTRLPFSEIPIATSLLDGFQRNLQDLFDDPNGPQINFVYETKLVPLLNDYAAEVSLLGAPFGLLLLQIGALVLFFLVATATLVRRGERRELAMLQSRGAFDSQLILLRGMEALLIALVAAVIAPLLAQQLLIGLAPVFTGIARLPLELSQGTFIFAGLAAGTAFIALVATLRPVLRLPLILAGGSASRAAKSRPGGSATTWTWCWSWWAARPCGG